MDDHPPISTPANAPRVGIVIPCFNGAATIAETLESIQRQDGLQELTALYLADNASEDDSVKIAQSVWKSPLLLVVMLNQRNMGQAANVNRTLRELGDRLDWVLIMHVDDVAKPHWLRLILERIRNCSGKVVSICSSYDDFFPDGRVVPGQDNPALPIEVVHGDRAAVRRTLLDGCWWWMPGCAIRLEAFRNVGEFALDLQQAFDWEWLLRCQTLGWDVEYIPRTLILYRQHRASVSSVSFSLNHDIRDRLQIITRYRNALSPRDWRRLHGRLLVSCLKRIARALSKADFARVARCSHAGVKVVGSCIRHSKLTGAT